MTDISAFSLRPGQNFTWNIQGPPLKAPISRKAQWTPELVRQRGWCGWFGQKCFSFEKKFTFILRRYIRLWWLMSIVSTCCYNDTITMFSTQWDKPMCDETISPACVATVPGFPGCLEVWLSFHASCHIFGDTTLLDSQSMVLIALFRMIHIQLHQSS